MEPRIVSKLGAFILLFFLVSFIVIFNYIEQVNLSVFMAKYIDRKIDLRKIFTFRSPMKSQSYSLWKSIRLNPEDKRGNCTIHRYGEPLQLYEEQASHRSRSSKSLLYPLVPKSNDFINCPDVLLHDLGVPANIQQKITLSMREDFVKYLNNAKTSCNEFATSAGYITDSLTEFEANFPIAFSIIMYRDVEQFEILLRTIYRPQNVYCIHVDKKSSKKLHEDVKTIASCFDNVFVTSYSVDVIHGGFTNLEPELICLRELWQLKIKWKYFINLTGQELPLRTNYELVRILKSFDGANNVETARLFPSRLREAGPVPYGLTPVKGAVHVTLARAFVDFVLHNDTSLALYEWARKVYNPDEIYFSTLNYNKQLKAPGTYKGEPKSSRDKNPFITRLKHWKQEGSSCHGKMAGHGMCIFGRKDLPQLATREELFVNKLFFGFHPEVMLCMQELLYNRTVEEYEGLLDFNVTYYATRDFVLNKF